MNPIFVVGCPRSGTTLAGSMLGAHPRAIAVPESQFAIEVWRAGGGTLDGVRRDPHFRTWEFDPGTPAQTPSSYSELLRWIVGRYAERRGRDEPSIWVDHTPEHVRHAVRLLEWFPEARFVHLVRDGRACAASVLPLDWGPNHVFGAAGWWTEHIGFGLALESFVGADRVLRVHFEDLLKDAVGTAERLARFAGLEPDAAMVAASGFVVPRFTKEQHARVGSAPDPSRAGAWRRSLSRAHVEVFEGVTGELLAYLGYALECEGRAQPPGFAAKAAYTLVDALKRGSNKLRFARRRRKVGA